VIFFKACPRCGGDVDATYQDDVRCIQCSHRPRLDYPSQHLAEEDSAAQPGSPVASQDTVAAVDRKLGEPSPEPVGQVAPCPRCDSQTLVRLDRLRSDDNVCYRCKPCGHIFSPAGSQTSS